MYVSSCLPLRESERAKSAFDFVIFRYCCRRSLAFFFRMIQFAVNTSRCLLISLAILIAFRGIKNKKKQKRRKSTWISSTLLVFNIKCILNLILSKFNGVRTLAWPMIILRTMSHHHQSFILVTINSHTHTRQEASKYTNKRTNERKKIKTAEQRFFIWFSVELMAWCFTMVLF